MFERIDAYYLSASDSIINHNDYVVDSFGFIWSYMFQCCQFSKRCLKAQQEQSLGILYHEYGAFNNLIIDRIEDAMVKLMKKFAFSVELSPCSSAPLNTSMYATTLTGNHIQPKAHSMFSIFISELWLNVILDYLTSVLKTSEFIVTKSKRKNNSLKKNNQLNKSQDLIELGLCKKLVCLVQKCFEVYVSETMRSAGNFFQKNQVNSAKVATGGEEKKGNKIIQGKSEAKMFLVGKLFMEENEWGEEEENEEYSISGNIN